MLLHVMLLNGRILEYIWVSSWDILRANHPGDVGGCCKDLWKKWLELDPDATWDKLFTAIDDCAATSASSSTSTFLIFYYI